MIRITVVGGGSVGLAVAASFAQAGAAVTLLARPASVAALSHETLSITGKLGEHAVPPGAFALGGAARSGARLRRAGGDDQGA